MDLDDPRLRHIAHAYATTVHAAQGLTRDKVIAVLDSGHGFLGNQQTFYVEISRARDEAIILTDNREQLAETLEENTGEVLTALEAVGESLDAAEIARRIPEKESVEGPGRRGGGDRALEALSGTLSLRSRRARGHGATEGTRRHDGVHLTRQVAAWASAGMGSRERPCARSCRGAPPRRPRAPARGPQGGR